MIGFDDFLCSEAVFGLSGVVLTLAGVAATGDEEFFSIISAGIFSPFFSFFSIPKEFYFWNPSRKKNNFFFLCPFYLTFIREKLLSSGGFITS